MSANPPSRYSRKSPRTNTFEADSKSGLASSHHQHSIVRPSNFERRQQRDVFVSTSEIVGTNHQVHCLDFQETLLAELGPISSRETCLSQLPSVNNVEQIPISVSGAEVPKKYRLNKLSFTRDSHLWRTPDEPSLNQILEQERNAWLAQSPTDPCGSLSDSDHESDAYTSYSLPASSRPADHNLAAYPTSRSHQPSPAGSSRKRKSCFQEGSMNEGSRAIASSWNQPHLGHKAEFDGLHQSDLSDAELTPRALVTGRASTSSSIDINEFKPLPATPSTFKSTIRRLGQSVVKIKPAHTSEHIAVHPRTEKKERRGLKKSLSTWKIFNNSASDVEDTSYLTSDGESPYKKTNYSSRTIKPKKSLVNNALSQKEVLDERKRKAEIAYSEQFGTARKKQKQSYNHDNRDERLSDWEEPSDAAISHKRGLRTSSTVRNIKSVLRRPTDTSGVSSNQNNRAAELSLPSASARRSKPLYQDQPQSCGSERNLEADADRLQKQSREELEKENQRLRTMLRGKEVQSSTRSSTHHSRENPSSKPCTDGPSRATVVTEKPEEQKNGDTCATTATEIEQCDSTGPDANPSQTASKVQKPAAVRMSRPDFVVSSDVPPVPPLPESLQQNKALKTISGNARYSKETATIKRRGKMRRLSDQDALPRPLSMVLEDVEGDNDKGQTSQKPMSQLDGTTDEENAIEEGCAIQIQPSHKPDQDTPRRWDWPEDVF